MLLPNTWTSFPTVPGRGPGEGRSWRRARRSGTIRQTPVGHAETAGRFDPPATFDPDDSAPTQESVHAQATQGGVQDLRGVRDGHR